MANTTADIANQALDAAAIDLSIGDLEEGTKPAQVLLRAYGQCLRQLLRAVHWDFARAQAPLTLLADATAQAPNVPTLVPRPWAYEYAYPTDCMKVRFVPRMLADPGAPAGNIAIPGTPLMTGISRQGGFQAHLEPTRFLVANETNYVPSGIPADSPFQGVSPTSRTVILSNQKCALAVYTRFMPYPSMWDSQFRAAMVAYLASEVVLALATDKKFGMQMRQQNIAIAKEKIIQARISDGNEAFASSDLRVDWMQIRNAGGGRNWGHGGDGPGVLGYGFDSCGFGDGSAY